MFVVVDANRFISALLSGGNVLKIFLLNKSLNKIKFISPEYLFTEIERNSDEIIKRSKLSSNEILNVFDVLKEQIELIPFEDFNRFINQAKEISPHEKDLQYFALALFNKASLWSNEKAFRNQHKINILSDEDLLIFLNK